MFHKKLIALAGGAMALALLAAQPALAQVAPHDPRGNDDTSDRTSGVIQGTKGASDVTMRVFTQADGRVRVEMNVKGPKGTDSVLAEQLSGAYNRNMGR